MLSNASQRASGKFDDLWEDLVVSILAVNQYSLEKTYAPINGLKESGLTDPDRLASWDLDTIISQMKSAGYNRGAFMTSLFASRLSSLGVAVKSRGIETCEQILAGHDRAAIGEFLLPIKGIGPKTLDNFCLLRGIESELR